VISHGKSLFDFLPRKKFCLFSARQARCEAIRFLLTSKYLPGPKQESEGNDTTFIPRFRDRSPAGFASAIFKLPGVLHNACIALGELEQRALVYLRFSSRVCGGHTAKNGVLSHKAGESTKTHPRLLCACVLYMPSTYF
jgi:hypothetical protein